MDITDILEENDFSDLNKFLDELMENIAGDYLQDILDIFPTKKAARTWFYTGNRGLGFKRPYDVCKEGDFDGIDLLIRCRRKL